MKILHIFDIPLRRKQAESLRSVWNKHGSDQQAMIIMQPRLNWGPFQIAHAQLHCAIIDEEAAGGVQKVLDEAKKGSK